MIEVMMAMVVFAIFMGSLMNAYFGLITANRDADEVRKMYSGTRDLYSVLTEDIRLSAVDFYSMEKASDKSKTLYLLSKDGLKSTVYQLKENEEKDGYFVMTREESYRDSVQVGFPQSTEEIFITSPELLIKDFKFVVSPMGDPYSKDTYDIWANQFQPQVTLLAHFVNDDEGVLFDFPLQTTISSRVYTKVDQRDELYDEPTFDFGMPSVSPGAAPVAPKDELLKKPLVPDLPTLQ